MKGGLSLLGSFAVRMTSARGCLRPIEGRTHQTTANGVRGEDAGGEGASEERAGSQQVRPSRAELGAGAPEAAAGEPIKQLFSKWSCDARDSFCNRN